MHRLFGLERPLLPDDVQIAIERVLPTERRMVITTQLPMDEPLLSFVVRYWDGRDTGIRAFNALAAPAIRNHWVCVVLRLWRRPSLLSERAIHTAKCIHAASSSCSAGVQAVAACRYRRSVRTRA